MAILESPVTCSGDLEVGVDRFGSGNSAARRGKRILSKRGSEAHFRCLSAAPTVYWRVTDMRALLQLMKLLLPGNRQLSAEDYLKPLVLLLIALIAGPDIVAAIELTTLLELLGAAMFLLSFAIGFKLYGYAALEKVRQFFLPTQYVALAKIRGLPAARIHGVLLIGKHNLMMCCVVFAWIVALSQLVR